MEEVTFANAEDFAPRLTSYQTVTKTIKETKARARKQELKVRKEQEEQELKIRKEQEDNSELKVGKEQQDNSKIKINRLLWREVLAIKPCRVVVERVPIRPGARVKVTTGVTPSQQTRKGTRRRGRPKKRGMEEFTSGSGGSDEEEPIFPGRR